MVENGCSTASRRMAMALLGCGGHRLDNALMLYLPEADAYRCPAGEQLKYYCTNAENGQTLHRYWTNAACKTCPIKDQCTTGNERRITRWEHEDVLETVQQRRRETVEQSRHKIVSMNVSQTAK